MLDRLAPLAHGLRILVEPSLHSLEHMLVLPARDPPLHCCRAAALERTGSARVGPIAAQVQAVFDVGVIVLQPFASGAAIDVPPRPDRRSPACRSGPRTWRPTSSVSAALP